MLVNKSFNLSLRRLVSLLLLLFSIGCLEEYSSRLYPDSPPINSGLSSSSGNNSKKTSKVAVVFLPGLEMSQCQFAFIESKLTNSFKDKIIIIKPTYREENMLYRLGGWTRLPNISVGFPMHSSYLPTQSKGVYADVKKQFRKNNIQNGKDPVVIIGISQGGLLAPIMADTYMKKLNIKGVVTINAPLNGVYYIRDTIEELEKFLSDGQDGLAKMGFNNEDIKLITDDSKGLLSKLKFAYGVKCMKSGSKCIKKCKAFIDKASIPFLLIGAYTKNIFNNIEETEKNKPVSDQKLEDAFAKFITGKESGYHDGLIATSSQLLMEDDQLTNLPKNVREQDKNNNNLYRVCIEGLIHSEIIVPIRSEPAIEINTKALPIVETNERVANHIIDFIDQIIINAPSKKSEDS